MAWKEKQGRMFWAMKSNSHLVFASIPADWKDIWILDPYPWLQRVADDEKLAVCSPAKGGIQLQENAFWNGPVKVRFWDFL